MTQTGSLMSLELRTRNYRLLMASRIPVALKVFELVNTTSTGYFQVINLAQPTHIKRIPSAIWQSRVSSFSMIGTRLISHPSKPPSSQSICR